MTGTFGAGRLPAGPALAAVMVTCGGLLGLTLLALPAGAWQGVMLLLGEKEIALLLLEGLNNKDIQGHLCISPNTLKTHLKHLYDKTSTANRKELILLVMKRAACATAEAAVTRAEAAVDMSESPT